MAKNKKPAEAFYKVQGRARAKVPIWKGPEEDGITYSLLSRFLVCRERFRLLVVEGLRPKDQFNHRIEYGQMWHKCEEALAEASSSIGHWQANLRECVQDLQRRYPLQQEQVIHWHNVCRVQFPVYVDYWSRHPDAKDRTPLLQEQTFDVPYQLPSGREVRLRGKWDSVDLIGRGKSAALYLQENKTKGDIDEQQLKRQLQFDLQTGMYLVALALAQSKGMLIGYATVEDRSQAEYRMPRLVLEGLLLGGVRYNVVRRPLSGGKNSIRQKQNETADEFYARLGGLIQEDPGHYFMRWRAELTPGDLLRFRQRCLDPILEQICDWWAWIKENLHNPWQPDGADSYNRLHWQEPYGVYNVLLEGGSTDLDEHLATGSTLGLERVNTLFEELD